MPFIIAAIIILVLAGIFLLWQGSRRQSQAGLPAGKIIYDDSRGWGKVEKPLLDIALGLTGKPDYIVEEDGIPIPVEVKSTRAPETPYENHVYQLIAYCLLIENSRGIRPPYGILRYRNRTFSIDYTPELKARLLRIMDEMRLPPHRNGPARSHEEPNRCRGCGYHSSCDQALES